MSPFLGDFHVQSIPLVLVELWKILVPGRVLGDKSALLQQLDFRGESMLGCKGFNLPGLVRSERRRGLDHSHLVGDQLEECLPRDWKFWLWSAV